MGHTLRCTRSWWRCIVPYCKAVVQTTYIAVCMQVADSSILRLTKELAWIEKEILPNLSALRSGEHSLFDSIFANELAIAVHATHEVGTCKRPRL